MSLLSAICSAVNVMADYRLRCAPERFRTRVFRDLAQDFGSIVESAAMVKLEADSRLPARHRRSLEGHHRGRRKDARHLPLASLDDRREEPPKAVATEVRRKT